MSNHLDKVLMHRALKLALRGRGMVSPNPRVGAVISTPAGEILGEGFHDYFGGPHAEVVALNACRDVSTRGATLYVSLEPCCFHGKTPACSDVIIRAGIGRVVAATGDPNPRVNGCGFEALKRAGIEVEIGVLQSEARHLNRGYFSLRERGRAWCAVKVALSLDGKMAAPDGQSKWITGIEARKLAHALRADHDAVMVGSGTVERDDPELTVRHVRGISPTRLILAPRSGIPPDSKLAKTASQLQTILVVAGNHLPSGSDMGCIGLLKLTDRGDGQIDPLEFLKELPEIGILSVLIEGGSGVLSSFMQADLIDEISIGIAPSVVGQGISPFERFLPPSWDGRPRYCISCIKRYGEDVVITFNRPDYLCSQD